MKNKVFVFAGIAVALVLAFIVAKGMFESSQKKKLSFIADQNSEVFVRNYSPRYGDKEAKVFLTEFLDPECESCRAFYPEVKSLLKEFEGKVQLVVRYAPFHRNSKIAIRALEAARVQGKYWEALEMLFHYQPMWGDHHNPKPELIFEYLPNLGLDMDKLKSDMKDSKIEMALQQDIQDMRKLDVRGTPTFFVNGKPLDDFSIPGLRALISQAVKETY